MIRRDQRPDIDIEKALTGQATRDATCFSDRYTGTPVMSQDTTEGVDRTNRLGSVGRLASVSRLGVRRLIGKLTSRESTRLLLSVTGIAVAIMLLTAVSGVALGLASQNAVQSEAVDYWVVPEGGDVQTIAVSTGGPELGESHAITAELAADDRVSYATPVLLQVIPLDGPDGTEYVLFVGAVPPAAATPTIAGLPTTSLTPGDPYYNDGGYNGTWTGEAVLNPAAAEVLNASAGSTLSVPSERSVSVTAVADEEFTTGVGSLPVALVHLSELQTIRGATERDAADQLLISTTDPGVRDQLEGLAANTLVVTRTGLGAESISTSSLPLAMAAAAFVVALVVGVLFTATMMGLEVSTDRRTLGTLTAMGYGGRSLTVLILAETLTLAAVGGVLGVGLGAVATVGVNALATALFGVGSLAVFRPAVAGYGLVVALAIGVCAAPYPIWLSRRTDPLEVIRR